MENRKHDTNIKSNKPIYKTENCNVLNYNEKSKELDIIFKGFGIRLYDIKEFKGDIAKVKYTSDIGKSDFSYELIK